MASIEEQRTYNMLDAELCMFTSNLCMNLTRDLTDLQPFGLDAAKVSALKALGDAFEIFPPDDALIGDLMVATETKNNLLEQVSETIRNMALRVQIKWGKKSGQYRSLGDMSLTRLMDDVLLSTARNVHTRMTGFLTDLSSTGLTAEMLEDYADLIDSFEVARNDVADKIEDRDLKTRERIAKGNELYGFVVNYCEIGKRVYEKTNQAKYNDYLIYTGEATGKPGKVQELIFTAATSTLSWLPTNPQSDSFQLEISTDGESWSIAYEDVNTSFGFGQAPGVYFARCRGINTKGNGAWSDVLTFEKTLSAPNIFEINYNPGTHELLLQMHPVIYAQSYDLYRSAVALGSPAGEFTFYQNIVNPVLQTELMVFNQTLYFYSVARLGSQSSEASNTVSVNVPA